MIRKKVLRFIVFMALFAGLPCSLSGQETPKGLSSSNNRVSNEHLIMATMCEGIKDNSPCNPAIVFSRALTEVLCFTTFDSIPEATFIYHKWFFKDTLNRTIKLTINPPRWSTYSRMHVRDGDEGPWHVEISDDQGNILKILRFSIVE